MCYFNNVSASNYDRKTDVRHFDTIHDILRCIRLVQWLFIDRNAPIWRKREPTPMRLSGVDGLTYTRIFKKNTKHVWSRIRIICNPELKLLGQAVRSVRSLSNLAFSAWSCSALPHWYRSTFTFAAGPSLHIN